MAVRNMHRKFGEVYMCCFRDILVDRHRQSCSHSTPLHCPSTGAVIETSSLCVFLQAAVTL